MLIQNLWQSAFLGSRDCIFRFQLGQFLLHPNGLINLKQWDKTVKLTTQQHLFRLSRNAVVTC